MKMSKSPKMYGWFWILITWNIRQILDHTKPTTTLHSCPKSPTVGRLNICVYIQWLFVFWIYISITNMLCQISKMSNPRPRLRTSIKDFLRHGKWHGWAHRTPKISPPVFRETREYLRERLHANNITCAWSLEISWVYLICDGLHFGLILHLPRFRFFRIHLTEGFDYLINTFRTLRNLPLQMIRSGTWHDELHLRCQGNWSFRYLKLKNRHDNYQRFKCNK